MQFGCTGHRLLIVKPIIYDGWFGIIYHRRWQQVLENAIIGLEIRVRAFGRQVFRTRTAASIFNIFIIGFFFFYCLKNNYNSRGIVCSLIYSREMTSKLKNFSPYIQLHTGCSTGIFAERYVPCRNKPSIYFITMV